MRRQLSCTGMHCTVQLAVRLVLGDLHGFDASNAYSVAPLYFHLSESY
jgi:hypothetical protein